MVESSRGGTPMDTGYMPEVKALAQAVARELLQNPGEITRSISFGQQAGELFVSSDPTAVLGTETITVDGTEFYIGFLVTK